MGYFSFSFFDYYFQPLHAFGSMEGLSSNGLAGSSALSFEIELREKRWGLA